jgi:hypothetical protein
VNAHVQPDLVGSPKLDRVVEQLQSEFMSWHQTNRRPSPRFGASLIHTLKVVALNLIGAAITEPTRWIIIPGRPEWYRDNKLLLGPLTTHASMSKVLAFLKERHYVAFRQGTSSSSVSFRSANAIKPTPKFKALLKQRKIHIHDLHSDPALKPIRLRGAEDKSGRRPFIEFEQTGEILLMADRLAIINRALLRHWPDIEITDEEHQEMLEQMSLKAGEDVTLDLSRRSVYRVFNNGTFENGGRFYGAWWQGIPKKYRPHITINGKRTVEVDYSALHPTILYSELGLEMPDDPYEIGVSSREVVKRAFNALINAKSTNIKPVEGFSEAGAGMKWTEFLKMVKAHFAPFKRYFGTGYGLKLQRLDSDIAEAVMLKFAQRGIPILPIHDSFIVHHGHEDLLRKVMEEKFEQRTGSRIKLKGVLLARGRPKELPSDQLITDDLMELLYPTGPYAKHDQRVDDWLSRRDLRN